MSNNSNSSSGGIGFWGLLGVAFIILKLCNVIDWPWWWVLAPIWGSFIIALSEIMWAVVAAIFKVKR